jgi:gamma-glutamylputrescine oxidase
MAEDGQHADRFTGDVPPEADVVVVGGGIAGSSASYHLASTGVRTVLLERERIGGGATGAALGVLTPPMRQPFDETVRFRGESVATSIWELALRSIQGLERLLLSRGEAEAAGLDLSGGHVLAERASLREVRDTHGALARSGLPVDWLDDDDVRGLGVGTAFCGGYRIRGGGCIDPRATARALAEAAEAGGATVLEGVEVTEVSRRGGRLTCRTERGIIETEMVVYAAHVDSKRFSVFLRDEVVPVRGQGMISEVSSRRPGGAFATHRKRNVWRWDAEGRLVLGGWRPAAWDRGYWRSRPTLDEELQQSLQTWFESSFPESAPLAISRRWSGVYGWTADHLPLVGPLPGRHEELVICGFSGGGLSFAFESGRLIGSIVTGGEGVPGGELLNPRRFA